MGNIKFLNANYMFLKFMTWYEIPNDTNIFFYLIIVFWRFLTVFLVVLHLILIIVNIYIFKDFETRSLNIANMAMYGASLSRFIYYLYRRKDIKPMIDKLNKVYRQEFSNGLTNFSMRPYNSFSNLILHGWVIYVVIIILIQSIFPLLTMDEDSKVLPIPTWLPYDWTQPKAFFWTYVVQTLTQLIFGVSFAFADMFYICNTYILRGEFNLLGVGLRNVLHTSLLKYGVNKQKVKMFYKIDDYNEFPLLRIRNQRNVDKKDILSICYEDYELELLEITSRRDFQELLDREFNELIKFHDSLLIFFRDELQDMFSPALGLMFAFATFYTIFLMFCMVTADNSTTFGVFLDYFIAALNQLLMFTFFSHMMTQETKEVRTALSDSPWHLFGPKLKPNVTFMLFVMQKPLEFKGLRHFVFSMDLFVFILKTSFSVFTMLQQIIEKRKAGQQQ